MTAHDWIINHQQIWSGAARERAERDLKYLNNLIDNLFQNLPDQISCKFIKGSGKELPKYDADTGKFQCANEGGKLAKMLALHSSSALVCNVFCYLYNGRLYAPLEKSLGLDRSITALDIEVKMKTGLRGIPPHLDVVLYCGDKLYGIESKFTEPYSGRKNKITMGATCYKEDLWLRKNLPKCAEIVEKINSGKLKNVFKTLDVPQLLKHALGLANNHKSFSLMYLWYEVAGASESEQHQNEIMEFSKHVGDEISFRPTSYQKLFSALKTECAGKHAEYIDYLEQRYFPSISLNQANQ